MSWNDHNHSGEYASERHGHDLNEIGGTYELAQKHHDHAGTYSHASHDHDQSDLWSAITDLQNTVNDLRQQIKALGATDDDS